VRIAFVNYTSRKIGGTESYLQGVLPLLAKRGHTLSYWAETDIPAHRPAIMLPPDTQFWSAAPDQLGVDAAIEELRKWCPDVLYVHKVDNPETESRLLDVGPAVFFSHDYHGTCISGTKSFSFPTPRPCHRKFGPACLACYFPRRCGGLSPITMVRLYRRQSKRLRLIKRYKAVVVASEYMAEEYRRHDIPADAILHTHKTVNFERPTPLGKGPEGLVHLAFLGRLEKLKGVGLLLHALPAVARGLGARIELEIAGQGGDEARLKSIASRVMKRCPSVGIKFHGWLGSKECAALLAKSHLMVMPSIWPEPFGGVGSIAGELRVPAVAFDVGGISQWLKDGVNGVLAPGDPPTVTGLAEALVRALGTPDFYKRLCEGAQATSGSTSMVSHVNQLEALLKRTVSSLASTEPICS
jgi:glycosyltransferase involved in cell wall biosynthesis